MSSVGQKTFSLPSAGGIVSLLNEREPSDVAAPRHRRGSASSNESLNTHSTAGPPAMLSVNDRRESSTTIHSTDLSVSPSPLTSTAPSANSGGSWASTVPTSDTDGSVDSQKRSKEIDTVRKMLAEEQRGVTRRTAESRPEGPHQASVKRHRSSSNEKGRDDAQVHTQSQHHPPKHILTHARYARSPSSLSADGLKPDEGDRKNVPHSMSVATDKRMSRREDDEEELVLDKSDNVKTSRDDRRKSRFIGGKKRYPCSHPGCGKTFSTSGHAARHIRIHTGEFTVMTQGSPPDNCLSSRSYLLFISSSSAFRRSQALSPIAAHFRGAVPASRGRTIRFSITVPTCSTRKGELVQVPTRTS